MPSISRLFGVSTILGKGHKELGAGTTDLEASSLMDYLEKKYPELNAEFDAVLFQAYSETPSDPHRSYPVFRVPKQFKTKES